MTKETLRQHALEHALELLGREIRELTPTAQAGKQGLRFGITAGERLDRLVKYRQALQGIMEHEQEK